MLHVRYSGSFVSRHGVVWKVEIYQKSDLPYVVEDLVFDAESPLVIEWQDTKKENVLCGSSASIRVISTSDRRFEDLYTIRIADVRMDVYRDNALYWSGMLDPEFYEEPYESLKDYTVSLTFSDFGILKRLKYGLGGMKTLNDILRYALSQSGINTSGVDEAFISTSLLPTGNRMSLSDLKVRSDNFYNEDGEASELSEVLEGVYQPLGLKIVQRCGKIYVYDLNALYHNSEGNPILWDGDSSTMGVDSVYNNINISWNTYAQSGNLLSEKCWTIPTSSRKTALNNSDGLLDGDARLYSYHYNMESAERWLDTSACGFTLWVSDVGKNIELLTPLSSFYKIVPQYDGQESEGIALMFRSVSVHPAGNGSANVRMRRIGYLMNDLAGTMSTIGKPIFRTQKVPIPPVADPERLSIRISIELLMDPRVNPFEGAVDWESLPQKEWAEYWKSYGNFVYIPVALRYQPDGSDDIYTWVNAEVISKNAPVADTDLPKTLGRWTLEKDQVGYLSYYDVKDRLAETGVVGWKSNRQAIGPTWRELNANIGSAPAGQYVPYPYFGGGGGQLWLEVLQGWQIINRVIGNREILHSEESDFELSKTEVQNEGDLWNKISWILMQPPKLEIINNDQFDQTINTDDVRYTSELNPFAKESLDIDTVCGSSKGSVPTARGAYFNTHTGRQITELTRAGRTSQIERLLMGTIYSQYATRHTTLSGEVVTDASRLCTYIDTNQPNKKFMIRSEVQDVITDAGQVTYVELSPDEYKD